MVTKWARAVALTTVLGFSGIGCGDLGDPTDPDNPPGPPPPVSFGASIQPIFTRSCAVVNCHAGPSPEGALNLTTGSAYAQIVAVTSFSYAPAVRVVPSSPMSSVLYNKIADTGVYGDGMPFNRPPLPPAEIELIRRWIEEGAVDN